MLISFFNTKTFGQINEAMQSSSLFQVLHKLSKSNLVFLPSDHLVRFQCQGSFRCVCWSKAWQGTQEHVVGQYEIHEVRARSWQAVCLEAAKRGAWTFLRVQRGFISDEVGKERSQVPETQQKPCAQRSVNEFLKARRLNEIVFAYSAGPWFFPCRSRQFGTT